jgi:LysR family transcriptional regulator, carnitine catabolism transcriptional activator
MTINLSLRQLEIFAATMRAGSFTDAAAKLSISQPALSVAIRKIEAELGLTLFDRTTRSVTPTADGRHLAAVAEDLLRDFKVAMQGVATRADGLHGRLAIAVLPSIAASILPRALMALQAKYPGIDVAIRDVMHERAVTMVADGLADFAVTTRIAETAALAYDEIGADRIHLVCRNDHVLAKGKGPLPWSALEGHPYVAMAGSTSVRRLADAVLLQADFALQPRYEVEQIASAIALVSAGLGVTALPALTFSMFSSDRLTMRPLTGPALSRQIGFLQLKGRQLSAPAQALVAEIRSAYAGGTLKRSRR